MEATPHRSLNSSVYLPALCELDILNEANWQRNKVQFGYHRLRGVTLKDLYGFPAAGS